MMLYTLCSLVIISVSVVFAEGPCHDANAEFLTRQSMGMIGAFQPRCLDDGTYANVQCRGSGCQCVQSNGEIIPETFVGFGTPGTESRDCNCARAVAEVNAGPHGLLGFEPRCDVLGNYAKVQCRGSVCFCANRNGQPTDLNLSVNRWEEDSLTCP